MIMKEAIRSGIFKRVLYEKKKKNTRYMFFLSMKIAYIKSTMEINTSTKQCCCSLWITKCVDFHLQFYFTVVIFLAIMKSLASLGLTFICMSLWVRVANPSLAYTYT